MTYKQIECLVKSFDKVIFSETYVKEDCTMLETIHNIAKLQWDLKQSIERITELHLIMIPLEDHNAHGLEVFVKYLNQYRCEYDIVVL